MQYDLFSFIRDYPHASKMLREMKKIIENYLHIMPAGNTFENNLKQIEGQERAWYQIGEHKFKGCFKGIVDIA